MPIVNSQSRHWLLCEYACGHLIIDLCVCVWGHLVTDLLCLCLWSTCSSLCALIALIRSFRSSFSLFSSWTSLLFSSSCLSSDCKRFCCFRSWEGDRERELWCTPWDSVSVCVSVWVVCVPAAGPSFVCVCVFRSEGPRSAACVSGWPVSPTQCAAGSALPSACLYTHTHAQTQLRDTLDQTCLQRWLYAPSLALLYFRSRWH